MHNPFGGQKTEKYEEYCLVVGDDRRLMGKSLESTGAYLLDKSCQTAYDNHPGVMGVLQVINKKGQVQNLGQCALLYEISSQCWNFGKGNWDSKAMKVKTILAIGRQEAYGLVSKEIEDDSKWERLMPVLYAALAILALVAIIACASAGLFDKFGEIF